MTLIRHLCRGRQEALSQQCCSWALWQGLISGAVSAKGNPAMFKLYLPADKLADGWALPCHSLQAVGVSNRNEPQRGNLSSGLHLCISEKGMRTTVRETERSAELPAAAALLGAGRKHLNTSGIICCINLWDFFFMYEIPESNLYRNSGCCWGADQVTEVWFMRHIPILLIIQNKNTVNNSTGIFWVPPNTFADSVNA